MVPYQGLAVRSPQLLTVPFANHNPTARRRPLVHSPLSFPRSQASIFQNEKKIFPLQATAKPDLFRSAHTEGKFMKMMPLLQRQENAQKRDQATCAASKNWLTSYSYPELTSKPRWWWRTLAALPYLMPLHNMLSYADNIYQLHPYLEGYDFLATAFHYFMAMCPALLTLMIFMTVYFFVVRRKWLPHFLRFHVIMAMLLDTGSQATATACTWMPSFVYQPKPMAYFWMAVAFAQIYTVLECIRCALTGTYTDVPFISDAAYIHSDLNLFR